MRISRKIRVVVEDLLARPKVAPSINIRAFYAEL
jgi:hypothetical protein